MRSSAAELYQTLNQMFSPQLPLSAATMTFGTPSVVSGATTSIDLSAVPGGGYYGSVTVQYLRQQLSSLGTPTLVRPGDYSVENVVALLSNLTDAYLDASDVIIGVIPSVAPGQTKSLYIQAAPHSLGWVGDIQVTLAYGVAQLADAVEFRQVQLGWPSTDAELPTAAQLMWSWDFTAHDELLQIDPQTCCFTNPKELEYVTRSMGLPGWQSNPVTDLPTGAVPGANPAFDRVVVMSDPGSDFMVGPMWFHYNQLENHQW